MHEKCFKTWTQYVQFVLLQFCRTSVELLVTVRLIMVSIEQNSD
jgi:hypothetical protein